MDHGHCVTTSPVMTSLLIIILPSEQDYSSSSFFVAANSLNSSIISLVFLDRPSSNFPFEIIVDV
jgi:hypothetical protein